MNAPLPPVIASAAKQSIFRAAPHAIVIGSGFGGLAAAIRLGARGYRVTILEHLPKPGGRASVFRQDGYTFDAGPTIITAPFLLEDLWELAGRKLSDDITLHSISPFYRITFNDGATFECSADPAAMREQVRKLAPADLAGYEKFVDLSEAIYKIGFEQLAHKAFGSIASMLRILPDLVRLQGFRSVSALVNKHVKDKRLRIALSFHPLLVGGNPLDTSGIYCLILYLERKFGVHFPAGGTGALVTGMVNLIESQGGTVRCNATVSRITVEHGTANGVDLANGEHLAADIIVSNACVATTYNKLLAHVPNKSWSPRRFANAKFSMGLFVWYFGTNRKFDDVPHHSILLGPRHDPLLRDIFDTKILSPDFSLYLHRPTATDPSLAPPDCDAFYVLSPVPNLQSGIDWSQHAEQYRASIETYLNKTTMPGLTGAIATSKIMTPADFETNYLSTHGAGFGLAPRLTQSAFFRPHNADPKIQNLFLVGASTHPGAGVPGVISSARVLDEVVPHASTFANLR
jgi:phytoene desaturase